jgi:isocitrate/isopropylmalate dehydrogenase
MLMLRYLNLTEKADRLENAVAAVIEEGKDVTYDMKPDRNDPTAVGTKEMADVIIAKMQAGVPHAGWAWIRGTDGDGDVRQGTIRD